MPTPQEFLQKSHGKGALGASRSYGNFKEG
jgi:hypothetical protein